ncbi:sugar ABC transporter permease [Nonomuraea sp. K274]|uniref:Sugar ABC transporter permease n=1 Tax=Nonomuraea cypriaca TaxID=1187855 RepID=A0A931A612_9ACTN|nr:sugar ABC transporter permease [Nonomuraea cypriaca]MBF8186987.1 sugar ABC transporter permease [Nonomuraea cypriaca]
MTTAVSKRVATARSAPVARRPSRYVRGHGRWALVFLGPWLIGMLAFTAGPMIASLYFSFTDFDLFSDPVWVGLENYTRMFTGDATLLTSLRVTGIYALVGTPLELGLAFLVAVLLNAGIRGSAFYTSVFYLPSLFGGSVAVAVLWRRIFSEDGLVNQLLAPLGIEGASWISDPSYSLSTLIALEVWQFGAPMVIFLAGLRQIPVQFYEAAQVDGAGPLSRFVRITVPLMTPIIFFNLILQLIRSLQAFAPAFIISGGTGGPLDSTLLYSVYLYQQAFTNFDMGYAAAMAWLLLVISAIVAGLNFLLGRKWVIYGD